MQDRTFISYARADRAFALNLAQRLRSGDVNVWIDELDIPKGSRWDDELEAALDKCSSIVFILSPNSVESQHVKDEVYAIAEKGGYVVLLLLKDCRIPLRYRRLQRIDFTGDFESAYVETLQALQRNLPKAGASGVEPSVSDQNQSPRQAPKAPLPLGITLPKTNPVRFRSSSVLLEEGQLSRNIFQIVSGCVRIFSTGENGREFEHERRGRGEFLAEHCLNDMPCPYSAQAIGEVICHAMSANQAERFLSENSAVAMALIRSQLRSSSLGIAASKNLALSDVYTRIRILLSGAASSSEVNGGGCIKSRMTHSEIATRVGASREMVSRIMLDLSRGGYITLNRGVIQIMKVLPARW